MRNVTFLATKKAYQQAPISTQVHFDDRRSRFVVGEQEYEAIEVREGDKVVDHRLGAPILVKDGKETLGPRVPLNVMASDTFMLRHGNQFDLEDPGDAFMVKLWLDCATVAESRKTINPGYHHFYLENPHEEAQALVNNAKLKRDVYKRVLEMSPKDHRDFAFADKKSVLVDEMTPAMLEAYIYAEADKDPARVLELLNSKDFKAKAFLGKLVQHGLVFINGGQYRIGAVEGEVMGIDEASAVAFLVNPSNALIVRNWNDKLKQNEEDGMTGELEEGKKQPVASK